MPTRTFLAFDLDKEIRRQLVAVQQQLDSAGAAVRWTGLEQLHVTLKFLGDVPDELLDEVCGVAAELAEEAEPFDFSVGHITSVPPQGHLRMLWVGIDEPSGRMAELNRRVEDAYAGLGFRMENRGFRPHLTLGRIKSGRNVLQLRQAVAAMGEMQFGLQPADELIVYGSELTRDGPIYTPLATCPLG